MLLRKLGYEILVAANGLEALQLLENEARRGKQCEVECILMDASMDVMDGRKSSSTCSNMEAMVHQHGRVTLAAAHALRCFASVSGIECTRVLRAQQLPHRKLPFIIALTANVTEEYRVKCLQAGMDRFSVRTSVHCVLPDAQQRPPSSSCCSRVLFACVFVRRPSPWISTCWSSC